MASDPIPRSEFEGYVRRHEADKFAHASMRHELRNEFVGEGNLIDARLGALERWQQRVIGGLMFGSLMLGGGGVVAVIEFFHK